MRHPVLLLTIALAACATTGSNGLLTIETAARGQPLADANCIASTNGGSWNLMTPATVQIGGVNGDLHVLCNKDGYRASEMIFRPSPPPGSYGSSVGVGAAGGSGHSGVGVGLNFPIWLGGGSSYPSRIIIEMNPQ